MCQTWVGMSIRARKTPETASRNGFCTRSGEKSTEYTGLLFCTDKIISSNKLSKRVKIRKSSEWGLLTENKLKLMYLELSEEVVDGSLLENKMIFR